MKIYNLRLKKNLIFILQSCKNLEYFRSEPSSFELNNPEETLRYVLQNQQQQQQQHEM